MDQKGLDYLQNAKTYKGQPVKNWLDELLQNPSTVFCFGTEHYKLTGGLYFWAWYKNGEAWKFFEFWPRERQYIAEQKFPDTQKIIDAYNDADKQHTSEKWRDFLELLPDAKIDEHLKKSIEWYGEVGLRRAIWDEQNASK